MALMQGLNVAVTSSDLASPELHYLMTVTRGWIHQRYTDWLEQTVTGQIPAARTTNK
jgi:hypothetical protein